MSPAKERILIDAGSVPRLAPHVRLRRDGARDRWVILAPERMLLPDDVAVAILQRVDDTRSIAAIYADLAETFNAPPEAIERDVVALLQDLADKVLVTT